MFSVMADTFYASLELKNIKMEGLLFSFLGKYKQNATEFGRNKAMNFRPSATLRTVPPFVTAHTFCTSWDIILSFLRKLLLQYFCAVYDYVKKEDLSKGYQNPKRKLGVTTHFSEVTELKFGKKLPYILCILTLFWNNGCSNENCVVTHRSAF